MIYIVSLLLIQFVGIIWFWRNVSHLLGDIALSLLGVAQAIAVPLLSTSLYGDIGLLPLLLPLSVLNTFASYQLCLQWDKAALR